jgi:hypothetical protein
VASTEEFPQLLSLLAITSCFIRLSLRLFTWENFKCLQKILHIILKQKKLNL